MMTEFSFRVHCPFKMTMDTMHLIWLCVYMHARKRVEWMCDLHVCVCLCSSSLFLHRGFGICLLGWRLINVTSFCLKIIKCQVLQWQQNVLAESQWREVVRVGKCLCVCCKGVNTNVEFPFCLLCVSFALCKMKLSANTMHHTLTIRVKDRGLKRKRLLHRNLWASFRRKTTGWHC